MARLIAGDFNMEYVGINNRTTDRTLLLELESSPNIRQCIKTPIRNTVSISSTIDLIFISIVLDNVQQATSINYNVSDHDINCLIFKKDVITRPKVFFMFRNMKEFNLAILNHRLMNFNWTSFYGAPSATNCWDQLYEAYVSILDIIASFQTKINVPVIDEWVNSNCLNKLKKEMI